eukprot:7504039-Pyramimonas_sp.AAC.1
MRHWTITLSQNRWGTTVTGHGAITGASIDTQQRAVLRRQAWRGGSPVSGPQAQAAPRRPAQLFGMN